MRLYRIDELRADDVKKFARHLEEMDLRSEMDGIFWLPVPPELLSSRQKEHAPLCGPYVMALEVEETALNLEFLVRSKSTLHCSCLGYADEALIRHMMAYVDETLRTLGVRC